MICVRSIIYASTLLGDQPTRKHKHAQARRGKSETKERQKLLYG
jgi:hypothetical protein